MGTCRSFKRAEKAEAGENDFTLNFKGFDEFLSARRVRFILVSVSTWVCLCLWAFVFVFPRGCFSSLQTGLCFLFDHRSEALRSHQSSVGHYLLMKQQFQRDTPPSFQSPGQLRSLPNRWALSWMCDQILLQKNKGSCNGNVHWSMSYQCDECLTAVLTIFCALSRCNLKVHAHFPVDLYLCNWVLGLIPLSVASDARYQTFPVCFLSCFLFITLYKNLPFLLLVVTLWSLVADCAQLIIKTQRQLWSEKLVISHLEKNAHYKVIKVQQLLDTQQSVMRTFCLFEKSQPKEQLALIYTYITPWFQSVNLHLYAI